MELDKETKIISRVRKKTLNEIVFKGLDLYDEAKKKGNVDRALLISKIINKYSQNIHNLYMKRWRNGSTKAPDYDIDKFTRREYMGLSNG